MGCAPSSVVQRGALEAQASPAPSAVKRDELRALPQAAPGGAPSALRRDELLPTAEEAPSVVRRAELLPRKLDDAPSVLLLAELRDAEARPAREAPVAEETRLHEEKATRQQVELLCAAPSALLRAELRDPEARPAPAVAREALVPLQRLPKEEATRLEIQQVECAAPSALLRAELRGARPAPETASAAAAAPEPEPAGEQETGGEAAAAAGGEGRAFDEVDHLLAMLGARPEAESLVAGPAPAPAPAGAAGIARAELRAEDLPPLAPLPSSSIPGPAAAAAASSSLVSRDEIKSPVRDATEMEGSLGLEDVFGGPGEAGPQGLAGGFGPGGPRRDELRPPPPPPPPAPPPPVPVSLASIPAGPPPGAAAAAASSALHRDDFYSRFPVLLEQSVTIVKRAEVPRPAGNEPDTPVRPQRLSAASSALVRDEIGPLVPPERLDDFASSVILREEIGPGAKPADAPIEPAGSADLEKDGGNPSDRLRERQQLLLRKREQLLKQRLEKEQEEIRREEEMEEGGGEGSAVPASGAPSVPGPAPGSESKARASHRVSVHGVIVDGLLDSALEPGAGPAPAPLPAPPREASAALPRDMGAERDEVFRGAVPRLRAALEARGLFFVPVDLRWGITDDRVATGQVVLLCLREVRRATYFVAFLKGRYGWHHGEGAVEDALLSRSLEAAAGEFPFVRDCGGQSVTEIEIRLGALNEPEAGRARGRFYFAEGDLLAAARAEAAEGPAASARLQALKDEIREAGMRVAGYGSPAALAAAIHDDLLEMVKRDYPPRPKGGWLDEERAAHGAFAALRCRLFVRGPGDFDPLDAYAADSGPELLLVSGPSGCGKSALLANWTATWRARTPGDLTVLHFVGGTQESASPASLVRRVYGEIKERYPSAPPFDAADSLAPARFGAWLAGARLPGRLLLVVDALDQIQAPSLPGGAGACAGCPRAPAPRCASSPPRRRAPPPRRPAAGRTAPAPSALPSPPPFSLLRPRRRRQGPPAPPPLLTPLHSSPSGAGPGQLGRLLEAPQCSSPLFLRTVLEELKGGATTHETLDARIAECLACPGPVPLYGLVLRRWADAYGPVALEALSAVAAAREGLAESELRGILRVGDAGEAGVTELLWSEFQGAAAPALVDRGGLLGFCHRAVEEAVAAEAGLGDPQQRAAWHARLGRYFRGQGPSARRAAEAPWHLARAGLAAELLELLRGDLDLLERLSGPEAKYELVRYWKEAGGSALAAGAYRALLGPLEEADQPRAAACHEAAGNVLRAMGRLADAAPAGLRAGGEPGALAASLHALAELEMQRGEYGRARALYEASRCPAPPLPRPSLAPPLSSFPQKALELARSVPGNDAQAARVLRSAGELHLAVSRYPDARAALTEALEVLERTVGPQHADVAEALASLAAVERATGDYDAAERARVLALRRAALGEGHALYGAALQELAVLRDAQGRPDEALELLERAVRVSEAGLGADHLEHATALQNLAMMLRQRGDFARAEPLLRAALAAREAALGPAHPHAHALDHLAAVAGETGRRDEAAALYARALGILEAAFPEGSLDLSVVLSNAALLSLRRGDFEAAEAGLRRSLEMAEALLGPESPDVATALSNLGQALARLPARRARPSRPPSLPPSAFHLLGRGRRWGRWSGRGGSGRGASGPPTPPHAPSTTPSAPPAPPARRRGEA
eukprot:tig00020553_g10571.t1